MASSAAPSKRTQLRRRAARGDYSPETVREILGEGSLCHLAFAQDGQPHLLPTFYRVMGDRNVGRGPLAPAHRAVDAGGGQPVGGLRGQ